MFAYFCLSLKRANSPLAIMAGMPNKMSASEAKPVTEDNLFAKLKQFLKITKASKGDITNSESPCEIVTPIDPSLTQELDTIHEAIEVLDLLVAASPAAGTKARAPEGLLQVVLTTLKSISKSSAIEEEDTIVEEPSEEETLIRLVLDISEEDGGSVKVHLVPATTAVAPIETTIKSPKKATFARFKKVFHIKALACFNPSVKKEDAPAIPAAAVLEMDTAITDDDNSSEVIQKEAPSDAIMDETTAKKKTDTIKALFKATSKKVKSPTFFKKAPASNKVVEVIAQAGGRVEAVVTPKKVSSPSYKKLTKKVALLFKPAEKQAGTKVGV